LMMCHRCLLDWRCGPRWHFNGKK